MQQELQQAHCYEEDEIDLKELVKTLGRNKKIIVSVTLIITLLAVLYVLIKTPVYEVKGLVEIGSYKLTSSNSSNDKVFLDKPNSLKTKLDIIFIESKKNLKDREKWIEAISVPKKSEQYLNVTAQGESNDLAIKKLQELIAYVQKEHGQLLEDIKQKRLKNIEILEKQITTLQQIDLPINLKNQSKIKKDIEFYKNNLHQLTKEFSGAKRKDATFALLVLTQQKNLQDLIYSLENRIDALIKAENNLKIKIDDLDQKIIEAKNLLKPYNYKNTHFVGEFLLDDKPAKPKKALIIAVAFVTGFILSIFFVFFLEFIRSFKEEENIA